MKKNRFLKTAGALLILCLLTTCVIGTTFAKYTTGGETVDSARVARWGVELELAANNELFENQYTGTGGKVTVQAATDVVAPGTAPKTVAVFSITGTPEVAVTITIDFTVNNDVWLKAGTYDDDPTTAADNDPFTLADDYYPVVFTLRQTKNAGGATDVQIAKGNLATIEAALNGYSGAYYAPNTDLEAEFELTWVWDFNGNDQADTYLANQPAGSKVDGVYNTQVGFEIEITVEQVD